jgi:outer membrane protein OmpA-like peptidoglycan-associated protein
LLLVPSVALANPVEISLKNQVPPGQKPSLTVKAATQLRGVEVKLSRDDGKSFTVSHGALRDGQSATLVFGDVKEGHFSWRGHLEAQFPDGNRFSTDLTFETATLGTLQVRYSRDHLDLDANRLEFQLSKPARGSATIKVFGDDGTELGTGTHEYKGEPAGAWLPIEWTQRPGNVMRLELTVQSDGLSTVVKLLPWSVRIPHEEVVFDTGQWVIKPSEEAKLVASYGKITAAVEKARAAEPSITVHLYIAGHTDTVGSSADNRKLSLERARAIATWYRDRGLPLPLYYAGFGEDALKVKTPDNTDEGANRRADYIVGVEDPVVARGVRADWRKL